MSSVNQNPEDFIEPLNINGLKGRMLSMSAPAKHKREILFVYGHHSSLERWWGLIQVLNRYGAVTMPDLPGFGGMDSFYTIGKKPTIDNLADYLAAFIKLRYKRKRLTIAGMSFGFVIVTRMLQRYPELTKKVDMLVSIAGFAHHEDFTFNPLRYWSYRLTATVMSNKPLSLFFRYVVTNGFVLRLFYARTHNAKNKFKQAHTKEEFDRLMDIEVHLWHANDIRTWMFTTIEFLKFDNCGVRVDLPVWHVSVKADHFFDSNRVEQHMQVIFTEFHTVQTSLFTHAPSVIADAKMAAPLIPPKLRRVLARN